MFDFFQHKNRPKVIVCCGSGGVGKTTISATIALHGALSGLNVMVLTIDPARRLADSLGIDHIGLETRQVPVQKFREAGLQPSGELHTMMLDTKRTFDRLILRYASRDVQKQIFANRYYQYLSSELAGSHEYMAMEKVYELYHENIYDLIVLDTPPSRRALDFLDAPRRLTNLLDHNLFWKLFRPYAKAGRWGLKMINAMASPFIRVIGPVMGKNVFEDVSTFFRLWDDVLFDGFRQRAAAVSDLLSSSETTFIAITSPMRGPMREALMLHRTLAENHMPFAGFIVNRLHPMLPEKRPPAPIRWPKEITSVLGRKIQCNFERFHELGKSDRAAIRELLANVEPGVEIRGIPCFERDIYDVEGLLAIREKLFFKNCSILPAQTRHEHAL